MTIQPIQRIGTTRRFSDAVVYNGVAHIVEVPGNLDGDITAQTENLLASIERLLAQAGSDKSQLLQATIYLADMADYDAMNQVWDNWLPEGSAPVRACLEAQLANPAYKIEIVLTAASSLR